LHIIFFARTSVEVDQAYGAYIMGDQALLLAVPAFCIHW
jgi:hypothetical protein